MANLTKRIMFCGDIHGTNILAIMEQMRRTEPDFCLQVGDYWAYAVPWPVQTYYITGNHEQSKTIREIQNGIFQPPENNILLSAGLHKIEGINIVALPSIPTPGAAPGPAHFLRADRELCESVTDKVDIFISHAAGFPFVCNVAGHLIDCGQETITNVLRKLKPTYAASGHNHVFAVEEHDGITCVRLGCKPPNMFYMVDINATSCLETTFA